MPCPNPANPGYPLLPRGAAEVTRASPGVGSRGSSVYPGLGTQRSSQTGLHYAARQKGPGPRKGTRWACRARRAAEPIEGEGLRQSSPEQAPQ